MNKWYNQGWWIHNTVLFQMYKGLSSFYKTDAILLFDQNRIYSIINKSTNRGHFRLSSGIVVLNIHGVNLHRPWMSTDVYVLPIHTDPKLSWTPILCLFTLVLYVLESLPLLSRNDDSWRLISISFSLSWLVEIVGNMSVEARGSSDTFSIVKQ